MQSASVSKGLTHSVRWSISFFEPLKEDTVSLFHRHPIFAVLLCIFSTSVGVRAQERQLPDISNPLVNQGPKKESSAGNAMVATQTYATTQVALDVLKDGGNAFDAYIAAAFYQQVTEPHMISPWGMISGIVYEAESEEFRYFDGVSERPLASRSDTGDPNMVAIGGTVKAMGDLWKQYGTKEWSYYLQPAIRAAEDGVVVTSYMYGIIYAAWQTLDDRWPGGARDLINNEEARKFYMPDGFLIPVGQRWKMPALAEHLKRLAAEGPDYMYTGEWGQKFVAKSNELGGRVTMEDMAEYEIRWQEPLRTTFNGYEIITEPTPSDGGLIVGYNLNILENFDLSEIGHYTESAETMEIIFRTSGRVHSEVLPLRDPVNYYSPADLLLSKEYGEMGAEYIRDSALRPNIDLSEAVDALDAQHKESFGVNSAQSEQDRYTGSNHNTIVDSEGNWISSLHTGHGGTAGVFIDGVEANGSGFPGDTGGPGRRVTHPITAVMIAKDGKPIMALGTPGSPPQNVTEVLLNILEFGMHPRDAVVAPRFRPPGDDPRTIRTESRISEQVRKDLKKRGFKIQDMTDYNWHTGSFQVVWQDEETGKLHGVSDPRRLGYTEGL